MNDLQRFAKRCDTVAKKFGGFLKFQEGVAKEFTPLMSDIGVTFLKNKVETGGQGLDGKGGYSTYPISDAWRKAKAKLGLYSGDAMASGATFKNLKVLKKFGNSKALIGLAVNVKVPHIGWGGRSSKRMLPIGEYIHYIYERGKPRPLLVMAIIAFKNRIFPKGEKILEKGMESVLTTKFGQTGIQEVLYKDTSERDVKSIIKKINGKLKNEIS